MKWILIVFCLIELLGAGVQYNDPDSAFWMVVYLVPLVLNVIYLRGTHVRWVNMIAFVVYLLYFLTFIPDFVDWAQLGFPTITGSMKAENPYIELVREGGGLLILVINLALLLRPIRKV